MSLASPFKNLNILGRDKEQTMGLAAQTSTIKAQTNDVSLVSKWFGGGAGT